MRTIIIFSLLLSIQASHGQVSNNQDKNGLIKIPLTGNIPPQDSAIPLAKLLYTTAHGQVYALPQDNMACIVPHTSGDASVIRPDVSGLQKMPNAFKEYSIIPTTGSTTTTVLPRPNK